jgi:hypothetical protein
MKNENTESNSAIPPASEILDIIPESVRRILDSLPGTEANYLTRAAGQVVTPKGEAVVEGMDLIQIAEDFETTVNSELAADSFQIPEGLLRNSLKSEVTDPFPVAELTTPILIDGELGKANVFTGAFANQRQSLFERISGASSGAQQDKFVDADDADNLIQLKAVDAAQLGGLRAWGGHDQILGTNGNDIVNGNAGRDKIVGASGNDLLRGGQDNDEIAGGEGDDLLLGNKGDDNLFGGPGNDVIKGGQGADVLMGKAGNDMLIAGGGDEGDFLMGAEGADQFILRAETLAKDAAVANRILDFNPLEGDLIKIAYFDGTLTMPGEITFAAVDVNRDSIQDTAILYSDGIVGVILRKDSTPIDLKSSILMVNAKDTGLSMIGDLF